MNHPSRGFIAALGVAVGVTLYAGDGASAGPFTLTSIGFASRGEIPSVFTCEGKDISPPLAWSGAPQSTRSFALVVDDPDASPKSFVHWIVSDLPGSARWLEEGASRKAMPRGATEGVNDFGRVGYAGPCPPAGRHRYFFKLYALDKPLGLASPTKEAIESALSGSAIAKAELFGTYVMVEAPSIGAKRGR